MATRNAALGIDAINKMIGLRARIAIDRQNVGPAIRLDHDQLPATLIPEMRRAPRSLLFTTYLVHFICSLVLSAHAYTFMQVGVDSNFLIDDGRVLFAQADGSLTVLSLETGQVLLREKSSDYSGRLVRVRDGILVLNYGTITLLNPASLAPIWHTTFHYAPNITNDELVSYDGNGLVQSRKLKDGAIRWAYQLPGALDIVAESGYVLIHCAATYEREIPTTVLLDLETGKEVFRKAPPGIHWDKVFFDGTNIYVIEASFKAKRSDFELERVAIWDTRAEEIRSIPLTAELRKKLRFNSDFFDLDEKTFFRGRIYADRQALPDENLGKFIASGKRTDNGSKVDEMVYEVARDLSLVTRRKYDGNILSTWEIELRTPNTNWTGVLPYLSDWGDICVFAAASGKLLIGSRFGHVECIDAGTGGSLWLYVFPTVRRTMSYSSHGMPPTMSQAAAIFRRHNSNPPRSGFQPINGKATTTHVIFDPAPIEPFGRLPLYLSVAWAGALLPFTLLILSRTKNRIRDWTSRNPGDLPAILAILSALMFFSFGRVSPGSSIALRLAIFACLMLGFVDAISTYRNGKRARAVVLILTFGIISFFILPTLLI